MSDLVADYCIVGGGAAGCVLASRLSEDPGIRVILLEAGPADWHPFVHIPAACLFLQHDRRFNWLDKTEPQQHLDGRQIKLPQGRLLGGSGSINGMLHVRPQRSDIDSWNTSGWTYDDVLPVLMRSEVFAQDGELRGKDGVHPVTHFSDVHPLTRSFIEACGSAGIAFNSDMNGPERQGAAFFQQNRRGRFRSQTAQTYLRKARRRSNLEVMTGAVCKRVLFQGTKAVGVLVEQGGQQRTISVRHEVVLSAGALRSPQILHRSGIGEPQHLASIGVPVVAARDQVGRNLRDHFLLRVAHRVAGIGTINERTRGVSVVREVLRFMVKGEGMLTMGAGAAAAILPSGLSGATPDIQLSFAPGSFAGPGRLESEPGMTIGGWVSPGKSLGTVMARSADPHESPAIDPNYLSHPSDLDGIIACVRAIRRIFEQPALKRWSTGETYPGPDVSDNVAEILAFAKERGASGYHFAGTCSMGDDQHAVVDNRLRVRGVDSLRVIDASVMPAPPIGNAHASVVMVAEMGAALMAEDRRTPSPAARLAN